MSELTALYVLLLLTTIMCMCVCSSNIHTHCIRTAGTHDLQLAMSTMHALLNMRRRSSSPVVGGGAQSVVHIPHYDKSLRDGRGDRVAEQHWHHVSEPVDVVLLEGESCVNMHVLDDCSECCSCWVDG